MKILAPKTFKDFKLKHASRLMRLSESEVKEMTFSNILQHVSAYTDTDISDLKKVPSNQIFPIFKHCLDELSKYKRQKPLEEIELNGQKYELVDIFKQKAGWLIDIEVEQERFKDNPEIMASLCYVEKGKEYGDVLRSEREDVFREHFPAYLFFDLNAFFLETYVNYTTAMAFTKKLKLKKEMRKQKRRMIIEKIIGTRLKR